MSHDVELVSRVLGEAREAVLAELQQLFAVRRQTGYGPLYDLLSDYPFREGKGLRPAICFAACRAAGGQTEQALKSAAALELFHNAFLVHDDVEDGSHFRRGQVTLFRAHGVPAAVNVGDATNVLALGLLLDNTATLGVRKSLQVFQEVERMARESAEGQAIELSWIANERFDLDDRDYVGMAYKKTCWYTVIAPLRIGVICGSPPGGRAPLDDDLLPLIEIGFLAGIAFQIHDDLLNLESEEALYGKESAGDLYEGKRTIMLLHLLRTVRGSTRQRVVRLLRTPRSRKRPEDVAWLYRTMVEARSLEHGRAVAIDYSERALALYSHGLPFLRENEDAGFLGEMLRYVIDRAK
ncbi:MAG: polyprenyl synthetase family protein [Candidatus Dormibacteraeota bacterium]|uniref:Polyprenyl synthetase family protein n=1 Tax=Candidatus Dormiibacter inghamiae TaxID=3127013 RepID=A0A934KH05_9BACT|nr:polyprenyl synthetase family protein [Candidatus Dormibacteraeota bacterium]MBJ7606789.1 polyprenyl synthetase family protein [Candidatus Dormibacteraeota bacterium]